MICSFPRTANSTVFPKKYAEGKIELELVPQGTLAERIRAGGAGIPAIYSPAGVGTILADGKETREFDGRTYLLERAIKADFAFIKARIADRYGNLQYNKTARNFGPIMATAANKTIAQAGQVSEMKCLDPEAIVTPGIFVERVIEISNPLVESDLVFAGATYP